jgi:hypothetical protein
MVQADRIENRLQARTTDTTIAFFLEELEIVARDAVFHGRQDVVLMILDASAHGIWEVVGFRCNLPRWRGGSVLPDFSLYSTAMRLKLAELSACSPASLRRSPESDRRLGS